MMYETRTFEKRLAMADHARALAAGMTEVLSSVAPRSTGLIKPCRHMIRLGGGTGNAVH
jgi:hypothetical protein